MGMRCLRVICVCVRAHARMCVRWHELVQVGEYWRAEDSMANMMLRMVEGGEEGREARGDQGGGDNHGHLHEDV
jgi:hypothetical protein